MLTSQSNDDFTGSDQQCSGADQSRPDFESDSQLDNDAIKAATATKRIAIGMARDLNVGRTNGADDGGKRAGNQG